MILYATIAATLSNLVAFEITRPRDRRLLYASPNSLTPEFPFDEESHNLCFQYWLSVAFEPWFIFVDPNLLRPKI